MPRHALGSPTPNHTRKVSAAELQRVEQVRQELLDLDRKIRDGEIDKQMGRTKAASAIETLAPRGSIKSTGGQLVHLYRICLNGWLREAAAKMLDFYPGLRRLQQTGEA